MSMYAVELFSYADDSPSGTGRGISLCVLLSLILHGLFFFYWLLDQDQPKKITSISAPVSVTYHQGGSVAVPRKMVPPETKTPTPKVAAVKRMEYKQPVSAKPIIHSEITAPILTIRERSVHKIAVAPSENRHQKKVPPAEIIKTLNHESDKPLVKKSMASSIAIEAVPDVVQKIDDVKTLPATSALAGEGSEQSTRYKQRLLAWLNQHKRYPLAAQKRRQQGVVTATFKIDRHGSLVSYNIHAASGYRLLDKAVEKMLKRASPMPEVPIGIRQDKEYFSYTVPIVFSL